MQLLINMSPVARISVFFGGRSSSGFSVEIFEFIEPLHICRQISQNSPLSPYGIFHYNRIRIIKELESTA
jgi:hypothetical protein